MSKANQGGPAGRGSDSEVLRAARANVAAGWVQHQSYRTDEAGNPVAWCATGAIGAVIRHTYSSQERCHRCIVTSLVEAAVPTPILAVWNDAPGRTQADVLAAFDKAIALASNASAAEPPSKKSQEDPQP